VARYEFCVRNREDFETPLALYRFTLAWAAKRSDRFMLKLVPGIYDDPEDEARFRSLGQEKIIPIPEVTDADRLLRDALQNAVKLLTSTLAYRIPVEVIDAPTEIVQVQGTPTDVFVKELTRKRPPQKAISGELCPVEDLDLFAGDRRLYSLPDYGRVQLLDLADEELESLCQTLSQAEFDPTHLVRSSPYVSDFL
jgi:hypothetical protein